MPSPPRLNPHITALEDLKTGLMDDHRRDTTYFPNNEDTTKELALSLITTVTANSKRDRLYAYQPVNFSLEKCHLHYWHNSYILDG